MNKIIDARGKKSPIPVEEAKQAFRSMVEPGSVTVLVDTQTAVHNLEEMAQQKNLSIECVHREQDFAVTITVDDAQLVACQVNGAVSQVEKLDLTGSKAKVAHTLAIISSDEMGKGDPVLGKMLMKGFIFALRQLEEKPETILFYNRGAFLTIEGSECLDDLKELAREGVEILTSATCLNHYGIADKLAVGSMTNMYVIAEKMGQAAKVIRP